jgi:hypothetical protein
MPCFRVTLHGEGADVAVHDGRGPATGFYTCRTPHA